jgi:hypothetical protein
MPTRALFINGNTNVHTFANAVLAADARSCGKDGDGLTDVFVLHSPESRAKLCREDAWRAHLIANGVNPEIFVEFTVNLGQSEDSVEHLTRHLGRFLGSLDRDASVYFDLTNGNSLYKNALSILSYIVGAGEPFVLELHKRPPELQADEPSLGRPSLSQPAFLDRETLVKAYTALSQAHDFDRVAQAWLVDVQRFSERALAAARQFRLVTYSTCPEAEPFRRDLSAAAESYFSGMRLNDTAFLGGAVRSVGRAFETLLSEILRINNISVARNTIDNIKKLKNLALIELGSDAFAEDVANRLSEAANLLRELRNGETHRATRLDVAKVRARLSLELLCSILDLSQAIFAKLQAVPPTSIAVTAGNSQRQYYFGVDGDDTGDALELLLRENAEANAISVFSGRISGAIKAVAARAKVQPINATVIFCEGDDLLFSGTWHSDEIEELHALYSKESYGRTCSIAFGDTIANVQRAMKLAKGSEPKGRTLGVLTEGAAHFADP